LTPEQRAQAAQVQLTTPTTTPTSTVTTISNQLPLATPSTASSATVGADSLSAKERLTVGSDYTSDRFLDVFTGNRSSNGPLARIGRLNPANRNNEHLTVASDYTNDRFLDVITDDRPANG